MIRTISIIVAFLLLSSCSAFSIHDKTNTNTKGVPFYVKKGVVKQSSTYTRTWVDVKINYHRLNGGTKIQDTERTAKLSFSAASYDQILLLKEFLAADASAITGFFDALNAFIEKMNKSCTESKKNCSITPQIIANEGNIFYINPSDLYQTLLTNSSSYVTIVDYQNQYYFNATVPPFGTTTASIELAADGTLSKASSVVDSTKLADLIPLKELLIDKWGLEKIAGVAALAEYPRDYSWTLSVSTDGFKYSLEKYHPYSSGLNLPPLQFDTNGLSVSREKFAKSNSGAKKTNKNAISIQGSIILPEK